MMGIIDQDKNADKAAGGGLRAAGVFPDTYSYQTTDRLLKVNARVMSDEQIGADVPENLMITGSGAVTAYWCCIGVSGIATPASRPTSGDQMPQATTSVSVVKRPPAVSTARTRPPVVSTASTRVCGENVTPNSFASRMRACARIGAVAEPSVGRCKAPSTPSRLSSGQSWATSSGPIR